MPDRRYRVLAFCAHPVQYMWPNLRRMAEHPQLEFRVAFCSLRGAQAGHDPEFGTTVQWDVPLLDGYDWVEVPNRGSGSESFFGLYNPELSKLIREGKFDYPCGDVAALAKLLGDALNNPVQLAEYGKAAGRRMESWSPHENIAAAVEAIQRAGARVQHTPYPSEADLPSGDLPLDVTPRIPR